MSDNKSNDAVLYSLKELKEMPAGTAAAAERERGKKANVKPVKKKSSFASDESADSLLAGILDDVESIASSEESERLKRLEEKRAREKAEREAAEAKKREEAERRLREEEERRKQAEIKRTGMLRAIQGPSQEEIAEKKRAEEEARKQAEVEAKLKAAESARMEAEKRAEHASKQARMREQQRIEALAASQNEGSKKGRIGLIIGLVAMMFMAVLLVGGIAIALVATSGDDLQDQTFAKTTYKPTMVTSSFVESGFNPVAKAAPVEEEVGSGNKTRTRRGNARRTNRAKKDKGDAKPKRKFNFGNDPFGKKGGIVF